MCRRNYRGHKGLIRRTRGDRGYVGNWVGGGTIAGFLVAAVTAPAYDLFAEATDLASTEKHAWSQQWS